ncbi:unnamed protein product [Acanthoscelides obtectus]|uniref:Uncharacterized protein n=1 Tax=Acanthoscelides obtectus TaxID=200917 RepID=A0A9P0M9D2_ACAOB|nr:unnamed protein product [Acanthoscelides obtectus]CAK1623143.1 hypothetical protein AOBTE_LOCUS1827 [Acanthoscelides obtectus]
MLRPPVRLYRKIALISLLTCSLLRPFVKSYCKTFIVPFVHFSNQN